MMTNDANSLILETKLTPPPSWGRDLLERQRLSDLLDKNRSKKLILITAAAGYGKSTLMSQWQQSLKHQGVRTAWLTLDEDDNDPGRLFTYLRNALVGNSSEQQLNELRKVTKSHGALLANLFATDKAPQVLFIDEFEALENQESVRLIEIFQQLMPIGRQLVIASRNKPHWSLAKLKLSDELVELGSNELRFNPHEASLLGDLKLVGPLSESIAHKLIDKTEGWVAGIRLAMLCFPRIEDARKWVDNISGEVDEITDFLTEEVFRHLGTEQQIFLLKIAVLDRLNAPLCEALTGETGAQTQLESLCHKGLFIQPLDEQRKWFRFHGLVRQFLRKKLQQLIPQKITLLNQCAAQWFNQNNYKLEAIRHAISANNPQYAAEILEHFSTQLVSQGQLKTLTSLAQQISEQQPIDSQVLLTSLCWAHVFLHEMEPAKQLLEQLKAKNAAEQSPSGLNARLLTLDPLILIIQDKTFLAGELAERHLPLLGEKDYFERGVLANIIAFQKIGLNEFEVAKQYQLKAHAAHLKSGSGFGLAYTEMLGALAEKIQGRFKVAQALFEKIGQEENYGSSPDASSGQDVAKSVSHGFEIELLYELNQLDQVNHLLDRYFHNAINNTAPDMVIAAYLTQARTLFAQGHYEAAYTSLEDGEINAVSWPLPRMVRTLRWERIHFALRRGDLDTARIFAGETDIDNIPLQPTGFTFPGEEYSPPEIAPLRFQIYNGQSAEALLRIEQLLPATEKRPCRKLSLLLLKALANSLLDQADCARQAMTAALELGCSTGAVRSIIDEGKTIIELLKQLHSDLARHPTISTNKLSQYCEQLLQASGEKITEDKTLPPLVEELTDRELEILGLVGEGMKNDQVAEKLFLSINTIKWHLRRAYEKLGVRSRTEALAKSRRLGLIE